MDLKYYAEQAKLKHKEHKKFLDSLKKKPPKNLDYVVQETHDEVFEEIDCLECANCCKTTSPLFLQKDIERLAKHFKIKPGEFIVKYLEMDEDGDFVFNRPAPCPFLGVDNYCSVYEARPNACREYPHTNQRKMNSILDLTKKNAEICPAVVKILDIIEHNIE